MSLDCRSRMNLEGFRWCAFTFFLRMKGGKVLFPRNVSARDSVKKTVVVSLLFPRCAKEFLTRTALILLIARRRCGMSG